MKKRLIIFSVAIMAFLAMPLRVAANSTRTTGYMGGYGVSGYVEIGASSAWAYTDCQYPNPYCKVSLIYYYVDERNGQVIPNDGSSAGPSTYVNCRVFRKKGDEGNDFRSYKATSTHYVAFGAYTWGAKPNEIELSVYY